MKHPLGLPDDPDQPDEEQMRRVEAAKACTCTREWKSYGRLYGVSMGEGWVRMDTDPDCPAHGVAS